MAHTWKWFNIIGGFVVGFILILLAVYGYRYQGFLKTDGFVNTATGAIIASLVCITIFGIATLISHLSNHPNRTN